MVPARFEGLEEIALPGGARAFVARSARARLLGMAWLDEVPAGWGLLIPDCSSIHTFGMRFALDVEFLARDGRVLRTARAVRPRRVLWCRGAAAVLERRS